MGGFAICEFFNFSILFFSFPWHSSHSRRARFERRTYKGGGGGGFIDRMGEKGGGTAAATTTCQLHTYILCIEEEMRRELQC